MAMSVRCEACNRSYGVKPELAGRQVRCPGCRQPLTVPNATAPTEETPTRSATLPWLLAAVAGGLLAVAVPIAILSHTGSRSAREELAVAREELAAVREEAGTTTGRLQAARSRAETAEEAVRKAGAQEAELRKQLAEAVRKAKEDVVRKVEPPAAPPPVVEKKKAEEPREPARPDPPPPQTDAPRPMVGPLPNEEKLKAVIRRAGPGLVEATSDNLETARIAFDIFRNGKDDLAELYMKAVRAVAQQSPNAWFSSRLAGSANGLSPDDLRASLGKEDGTEKGSVQFPGQFAPENVPVTWHLYGWCGFGVGPTGKVIALKAECKLLNAGSTP